MYLSFGNPEPVYSMWSLVQSIFRPNVAPWFSKNFVYNWAARHKSC